mgnify:CR=1 FL=1
MSSKDTKMAKNMLKIVRKYVTKHYPDEADLLMSDTERYYRRFKAECPDLGGDDNMLAGNLDMGLIVFAAYEASDHRMGKEAIEEMMDMRMEMLSKYGKILDANKRFMVKLMEASYRPYKKKLDKKLAAGEWGNTWGMEINPDNHDEGFAFTLIGCPIAEFAKEHGYLDLMPSLCASDHALAKMMHAKLIRTHTVALGSDSCDYWYLGDKSEILKRLESVEIV